MELFGADLTTIGRVLVGAVPAVVTLVGLTRGPGAMRSRLKHDVEVLEKLPAGTEARTRYEAYLAIQVERFAKLETESRRDIQGLVIAGFLVVGVGAIALYCFALEGWWWWICGVVLSVFAIAGLSTMFEAAQRVPRNEKGKPT